MAHLYRDTGASALVEGAFVLLFLFIAFSGMIEITAFLTMKERVEKAANQTANVLAGVKSLPSSDVGPAIAMAVNLGKPQCVKVRVTFCNAPGGGGAEGGCASAPTPPGGCGSFGGLGAVPHVVVGAAGFYSPMLNLFQIFEQGLPISSVARAPLYNFMR